MDLKEKLVYQPWMPVMVFQECQGLREFLEKWVLLEMLVLKACQVCQEYQGQRATVGQRGAVVIRAWQDRSEITEKLVNAVNRVRWDQ